MTPQEIMSKSFERAMKGYRADEVDAYLAQVGRYLEESEKERAELQEKLELLAEKLEEYRADEDSLRAALIGAQKLGDSVVRESKKQAEQLLTDATKQAEKVLAEANHQADSIVGEARRSIDQENYALSKLKLEVAKFKKQILNMYEKHLDLINTIPYDEDRLPPLPERPGAKQQPEPPPPEEALPAQEEARLEYEEVVEDADVLDFPGHSSKFGKLQFGEDYNLTRRE